ncbi:MAG: DnaD domain protein [Bacilli bacterium]|nr:DnaD domain protein [Bacilli bacterium]
MALNGSAIDFHYVLLDHYKAFGIEEDELAVILMIDHLLKQGNELVTADLLSLKMNYKPKELDALIVNLVKKGLLEYDTSGKTMRTSLKPLEERLVQEFQNDIAKDKERLFSAERSEALSNLFGYFEKRLSKALSPVEKDAIATWLDDRYSEQQIKDALEDGIAAGKKTIRSLDKILRSQRARSDIQKEGYTAVDDRWNEDIERTIEIAKTRWVKDDDDE